MISTFSLAFLLVTGGISICLDPGHGGTSTGAVGEFALEKDVVLDVALQVQNWLCQVPGISQVALTRDGDYDVSLAARSGYANANGFDRFISIHENAFNGIVQGTETFADTLAGSSLSWQLASLVQSGILQAYGYPDRGVKDGGYLHVIRETDMPAILGEGSFLDYDQDWNESWLYAANVDDHTGVQAWSYADAVCSHFGLQAPAYGNGVILMDNTFPGFALGDSLMWTEVTSGAPWMANCFTSIVSPSVWARWESVVPVTGTRGVELWWTSGMDRSSSVRCMVHHSSGTEEVFIDQAATGEKWVQLGEFDFSGSCTLELAGDGSSPGVMCADAVRLVYPLGTGNPSEASFAVEANPASAFIFSFPEEVYGVVDIFDLTGRLTATVSGTGGVSWAPEDVVPGVYFALERTGSTAIKLVLIR